MTDLVHSTRSRTRRGSWQAMLVILAVLLAGLTASPASAAAGTDTLSTGEQLQTGQSIVSSNGLYRAIMQADGNFVLYGPTGSTWSSRTWGAVRASTVVMQADGNLVVYSGGVAEWATMSPTVTGANRLVMQSDGNLVVYDGSVARWASGTRAETPPPPTSVAPSTLTDRQVAQRILATGRVTGDSVYVDQIRAYAAGRYSCHINPTLLRLIYKMVQSSASGGLGHRIYISSLNRYCTQVLTGSGTYSYHWRSGGGHAVDLAMVDGVRSTGAKPTDLKLLKELLPRLPKGSALGQKDCRAAAGTPLAMPSGVTQFDDFCNHNHIQVPVK